MGLKTAYNNRYLDLDPSSNAIGEILGTLEDISITRGASVGIARPLPVSLQSIATWGKNTTDQGEIALVPVSAIANRQPIR